MNHSITIVSNPLTIINGRIGRLDVFSLVKKECSDYVSIIILTNVAKPLFDIGPDQLLWRPISFSPLIGISPIYSHRSPTKLKFSSAFLSRQLHKSRFFIRFQQKIGFHALRSGIHLQPDIRPLLHDSYEPLPASRVYRFPHGIFPS